MCRLPVPCRPWVLEVKDIGHYVGVAPPLLILRLQGEDARLKPDVAKAVCRSSTLDDDDGTSKHTLTMMINRSRTGTRCHINPEHMCQVGRIALRAYDGVYERDGRYGSSVPRL